jgi:hypothetical protein
MSNNTDNTQKENLAKDRFFHSVVDNPIISELYAAQSQAESTSAQKLLRKARLEIERLEIESQRRGKIIARCANILSVFDQAYAYKKSNQHEEFEKFVELASEDFELMHHDVLNKENWYNF